MRLQWQEIDSPRQKYKIKKEEERNKKKNDTLVVIISVTLAVNKKLRKRYFLKLQSAKLAG